MSNGHFISFIGLPASGKTSSREDVRNKFLEQGVSEEDFKIISPDEIRFRFFNTQFNPEIESQVWSIVKAKAGECLSKGKTCLLDGTNLDPKKRKDFISIADYYNAKKTAVVFDINFEIAIVRNRRPGIETNGTVIGQTVPNYAMYRMKWQWDKYGLNAPEEEVKEMLKKEGFDLVEIIKKLADEKDCEELGGELKNGKCVVTKLFNMSKK